MRGVCLHQCMLALGGTCATQHFPDSSGSELQRGAWGDNLWFVGSPIVPCKIDTKGWETAKLVRGPHATKMSSNCCNNIFDACISETFVVRIFICTTYIYYLIYIIIWYIYRHRMIGYHHQKTYHLSTHPPTHRPTDLPLPTYLPTYLPLPPTCLYTYLPTYLAIYLHACLPTFCFVHLTCGGGFRGQTAPWIFFIYFQWICWVG
jgi:hypothetical protein